MDTNFIIKKSWLWFFISFIVIAAGLGSIGTKLNRSESPFNLGIDFTGGNSYLINIESVEAAYKESNHLDGVKRNEIVGRIREILSGAGMDHLQVNSADEYYFLIKTALSTSSDKSKVSSLLSSEFGEIEVLESDFIGPTIGYELKKQSLSIISIAVVLLLIYITFRFEFVAGIAAIIALIHDAVIVLGLSSILSLEVNTAFVAAILTILGYSINDTIVVFDRIRENTHESEDDYAQKVGQSINQTITRSINTSITTLVVLLSIYLFGGSSLKDFSLVLFLGILSGTYSSIFIASPVLVRLKKMFAS
jgi:preprotein translocase subunit SecF